MPFNIWADVVNIITNAFYAQSTKMITHLEASYKTDHRTAIAYFYVIHNEPATQDRRNLTISLMVQLFGSRPDSPQALFDFRRQQESHLSPTEDDLDGALHAALQDFDNVYVVVDGLDECPNASDFGTRREPDERTAILRLCSFLRDWKMDNLHLVVVSRPESDIAAEFARPAMTEGNSYVIDLSTAGNATQVEHDMLTYMDSVLSGDKFGKLQTKTRDSIKEKLADKAQGM